MLPKKKKDIKNQKLERENYILLYYFKLYKYKYINILSCFN